MLFVFVQYVNYLSINFVGIVLCAELIICFMTNDIKQELSEDNTVTSNPAFKENDNEIVAHCC